MSNIINDDNDEEINIEPLVDAEAEPVEKPKKKYYYFMGSSS